MRSSMRNFLSLLAVSAISLSLTACCSDKEGPGTYPEWPKPGATEQGPVPGSAEDFHQTTKDRIFFAFDRSDLSSDSQMTLSKQAEWFKQWPSVALTVEGHCDERGTQEYNLALGERRANAVRNYLEGHGVDKSRVNIVSYGKEHPENPGHDEKAWSENRRAVTVIN